MPTRPQTRLFATPEDLAASDFERDIGAPSVFPFTRGVQPDMYRGRPWTMRQYAGFATAAESNRRFRYLLARGVSGLSVAFDLSTQIGYDSDHPLAAGEVGRVGVAIDSIEDMAALFDGIPLERVSTSMTINATAIILLALYAAVARRQGAALHGLSGTLQNDILKEYVARGTYIYPPRPSLRIVTDIMAYCAREMPRWNTISISGYHIREAGATAVQEVAFTLAHAGVYVQAAIDAGLDVNTFARRISFFLNAHNNFLEEIAKFRAARRMWARIMRDRFGATHPRAQQLRFHTQTAGSTLTAQQPDNNIVRVALQALAAVLGGTQSLHCNGRDEALALPTEESAMIALRTQQILLHESGVANTVDPMAGAYTVETLTNRIEREATELLAQIDAIGGGARCRRDGLRPTADPGCRVPRAAGDRRRRGGGRGSEPLRSAGRSGGPDQHGLPPGSRAGAPTSRAGSRRARRTQPAGVARGVGPRRAGRAGRVKPRAADHRGCGNARHARGDRRRASAGFRRVSGHGHS